MLTSHEVAERIWGFPTHEIIELPKTIKEIFMKDGLPEWEALDISDGYLPLVKKIIEGKIEECESRDEKPKFIFSETSPNRLIGVENIGNLVFLTKVSGEIVTLVDEINEISQSRGEKKIFDLTPRAFQSQPLLHKPVKTKIDLGIFIDALYFIVYEASRDLNRIPKTISEIVVPGTTDKLKDDFVGMEIKHLRSYFRHDTNQRRDPEKISTIIPVICFKYAGKKSIAEFGTSDFLKFQEAFLKSLKGFLTELKNVF